MKQYLRIFFVATAIAIGCCCQALASSGERIEQVDSQRPGVKVTDGLLELTAPDGAAVRFDIYSITGQLVKSVNLQSETVRIELPQGCYIVRTPGRSVKVVVK